MGSDWSLEKQGGGQQRRRKEGAYPRNGEIQQKKEAERESKRVGIKRGRVE